jgi:hypothetical protein
MRWQRVVMIFHIEIIDLEILFVFSQNNHVGCDGESCSAQYLVDKKQ